MLSGGIIEELGLRVCLVNAGHIYKTLPPLL